MWLPLFKSMLPFVILSDFGIFFQENYFLSDISRTWASQIQAQTSLVDLSDDFRLFFLLWHLPLSWIESQHDQVISIKELAVRTTPCSKKMHHHSSLLFLVSSGWYLKSVKGITILNLCIQNKGKPICHVQRSIKPLITKPLKLGKLADVHLTWESQIGGTPLHLWCTWFKIGVFFSNASVWIFPLPMVYLCIDLFYIPWASWHSVNSKHLCEKKFNIYLLILF